MKLDEPSDQRATSAVRSRSRGLVVGLVGVALALLAAEAILRAVVPSTTILAPNSDAYWREHFRREPHLAPDVEFDEVLGWRMRRNWNADGAHHDADGHRITPSPGNATRAPILLLGDSFTYGLGVRDEETFAAELARRFPERAVINSGTNGWGLDQEVRAFETELAGSRPALVVVGYFLDDFRRNGLSFREGAKPRFVLEKNGLRLDPAVVPPPEIVHAELESSSEPRSYLWAALQAVVRRLRGQSGAFASEEEFHEHAQLSERLLARLAHQAHDVDARLLVLTIPHCAYDEYPDAERIEAEITASCARLGLDHLSLTPVCRAGEERGLVVFNTSCHWSAAGHALVAEVLAERIKKSALAR